MWQWSLISIHRWQQIAQAPAPSTAIWAKQKHTHTQTNDYTVSHTHTPWRTHQIAAHECLLQLRVTDTLCFSLSQHNDTQGAGISNMSAFGWCGYLWVASSWATRRVEAVDGTLGTGLWKWSSYLVLFDIMSIFRKETVVVVSCY